jgi:hypothetical protein
LVFLLTGEAIAISGKIGANNGRHQLAEFLRSDVHSNESG